MPKIPANFSNTTIYKIYCLDSAIKDSYVGYTTNFVRRKHTHKQNTLLGVVGKLYDFIRLQGGWSKWKMEVVTILNCKDIKEVVTKHQEYVHRLKATLNAGYAKEEATVTNHVSNEEAAFLEEAASLPLKNMDIIKTLIVEMVKSNADLKQQCMEMQKQFFDMCKTMQPTTNNINTNINNNTFNLQVFLNEHCKNAMNLKDFVDSIVLSLDDLELVGKKGFVDGIANIVICKLKATDVHMRPIHCSDAKREIMYIKENNIWSKDGPNNENMRTFVQYIERKNIRLLSAYIDENPDCMDSDSPLNDHYLRLTGNATCATEEHIDKVIKKIAREVVIDKM
jgi:hypothetical protein